MKHYQHIKQGIASIAYLQHIRSIFNSTLNRKCVFSATQRHCVRHCVQHLKDISLNISLIISFIGKEVSINIDTKKFLKISCPTHFKIKFYKQK